MAVDMALEKRQQEAGQPIQPMKPAKISLSRLGNLDEEGIFPTSTRHHKVVGRGRGRGRGRARLGQNKGRGYGPLAAEQDRLQRILDSMDEGGEEELIDDPDAVEE